MPRHAHPCLIGRDVKPPRTTAIRRNRSRTGYRRWLVPTCLAIITLTLFLIATTR